MLQIIWGESSNNKKSEDEFLIFFQTWANFSNSLNIRSYSDRVWKKSGFRASATRDEPPVICGFNWLRLSRRPVLDILSSSFSIEEMTSIAKAKPQAQSTLTAPYTFEAILSYSTYGFSQCKTLLEEDAFFV